MSTSAYENAAAMLRKQQRTTARLRVGLPALLAHFEQTELLPPEPIDGPGSSLAPTDEGRQLPVDGSGSGDGGGPGAHRTAPSTDR